MAKLSVKLASTGEVTLLEDVNLETLTSNELITELVNGAVLKPVVGEESYYFLSKENQPIYEKNKILKDLGFKDGNIITMVERVGGELPSNNNFATMQVRLAWSGEEITIAEVNINEITINDLISALIDGNVLKPNENWEYYTVLSMENQPVYEKNKTLNDLGFKDGDTITILIRRTTIG